MMKFPASWAYQNKGISPASSNCTEHAVRGAGGGAAPVRRNTGKLPGPPPRQPPKGRQGANPRRGGGYKGGKAGKREGGGGRGKARGKREGGEEIRGDAGRCRGEKGRGRSIILHCRIEMHMCQKT